MLGLGFGEMIVLAGIALVVMGPEKFPEMAKLFLRTVRDIRGYWDDAQRELRKETEPLRREINKIEREQRDFTRDLKAEKDWKRPETKKAADTGYEAYGTDPADEKQPGSDELDEHWEEPQDLGPMPYSPPEEPDAAEKSDAPPAPDVSEELASLEEEPVSSEDEFDIEPPERID